MTIIDMEFRFTSAFISPEHLDFYFPMMEQMYAQILGWA